MARGGCTRRGLLLAGGAALCMPVLAQDRPVPVWVARVTGLPDAPGSLDARGIFIDAIRQSLDPAPDVAPLTTALREDDAQVRIAPAVRLEPMPRAQARLTITTHVALRTPGAAQVDLQCRSVTSLVLAMQGEGGWAEPGLWALRSALKRCARDLVLLVSTELGMRRRGYWRAQVGAERLETIAFTAALADAGNAFLILRETDTALFLAAMQPDAPGRIADTRLIVDKPLVEERRRAAAS